MFSMDKVTKLEVTFEEFQALVKLLTRNGKYNDMTAYNIISGAMKGESWAFDMIDKAKLRAED